MEAQKRPITATRGRLYVLAAVAGVALVFMLGAILNLGPFRSSPLRAAEFRVQGDEICADAHAQFTALQRNPPQAAGASAEVTSKLVAVANAELADMRSLDAPASARPALDRYLAARERGIAILERGAAAANARDGGAYARAQKELAATQSQRAALARAVGFRECSEPISGRQ